MPLQMWFNPTHLLDIVEEDHDKGKKFRLGVPTELHKYWISENLLELISAEIAAKNTGQFELELVVTGKSESEEANSLEKFSQTSLLEPNYNAQETKEVTPKPATTLNYTINKGRDTLNPEYSFSTFVVGRNNEFAHAASYNIAKNPGADNYNPLFICGNQFCMIF